MARTVLFEMKNAKCAQARSLIIDSVVTDHPTFLTCRWQAGAWKAEQSGLEGKYEYCSEALQATTNTCA